MRDRHGESEQLGGDAGSMQRRITELETALEAAIRGELDAVVTTSPDGGFRYRVERSMLFQTFIEEMVEAAVALEGDARISYCNDSFLSITGYTREELYGTLFSDYLPEETREQLIVDPGELEERQSLLDTFIIGKDGRSVPVHLSVALLSFDTVLVSCITIHDLTAQREQEANSRFRLRLLDAVGQAVVATQPSGIIIYWNTAAERIYGWKSDEVLGKNIVDVTPATASRTRAIEIFSSLQKGEIWEGEFDVQDKAGRRFPVFITDTPILDTSGNLTEIIGVSTEMSERRERERQLEESEARYRHLFKMDLTGDVVSNADGEILEYNAAFAKIFGIPPVDEPGRHNMHEFWPRDESRDEFIAAVNVGKNLESIEQQFLRLDGAVIHAIYNASGIFDDQGNLEKICVYFFDITDRKHLEAELSFSQKMEAVGRLAGGVAHDFNNMLMVIDGFSGLLQKELVTNEKARKYLTEIRGAAGKAANLTSQLLAFGRKQPLDIATVDLNRVIQDTAKLLERVISENIHLELQLSSCATTIKGDIGQLGQILINLSTNARDAMPDGGILTVSTSQIVVESGAVIDFISFPEGPYAVLEVRDTGVGMDDETRANIFEPFYTTKKSGAGTGLGLPSVYGIVKQSGGYIFCESELGQGTIFRLYFPLLPVSEMKSYEREPVAQRVSRGTERTLLVEDDEQVRTVIGEILRLNGYTVTEARDGAEAIRIMNAHPQEFDLVLTDIIMPVIGGIQVAEAVQSLDPSVGILFISGYNDIQQRNMERITNPWRMLHKPLEERDLLRALREILDLRGKGR